MTNVFSVRESPRINLFVVAECIKALPQFKKIKKNARLHAELTGIGGHRYPVTLIDDEVLHCSAY